MTHPMKALLVVLLLTASPSFADSLTDYGAAGDGVSDTAPAWREAVTAVCSSKTTRTLRIPVGVFRFYSPPAPVTCALNIIGEGPAVTNLVMDFNQGWGIKVVGGQDFYGGGSLRDLEISVAPGRAVFFCGWVQAQPETNPNLQSRNPHGFLIDNVFCSLASFPPYDGRWNYGWYLDGSLNASPPSGVAAGIRYVRIRNSSVAGAVYDAWLFYYAFGTMAVQIDCFAPRGTNGIAAQSLNSANTYVLSTTCEIE